MTYRSVSRKLYSNFSLQDPHRGPFTMDMETLNTLVAQGWMTELNYMTEQAAEAARALEAELLKDAKAGVDVRVRLVGVAVSQ
jgi:hypothetical protein